MLRVLVCVSFLLLLAGLASAQPTVTWTGDGGDNIWNNPANWDAGRVPTEADNVYIPAGTPECVISTGVHVNNLTNDGTIASQPGAPGGTYITAHENILNYGTMGNSQGAFQLWSESGTVVNNGVIQGDRVGISAGYLFNESDGTIETNAGGQGIHIYAADVVSNQGLVHAGLSAPRPSPANGVAVVTGSEGSVINSGYMRGGDGVGNGGYLSVWTGTLNNSGTMKPGDGLPEPDGEVTIVAQKINNTGAIGGTSGMGDRQMLGNTTLVADTIILPADSGIVIDGNELRIMGRAITISYITGWIFFEGSLDFYTTADGWIDFSGTHAYASIISPGVDHISRIFSDSIIPPVEGLDHIFECHFDTFSADTTVVSGTISKGFSSGDAGATDTLKILMQNQSTASKVLDYSVSSIRGWVTSFSGSTSLLSPFEFADLDIPYTIPGGTPAGVTDSVRAILTVEPSFADTSYSEITCRGPVSGIADRPSFQEPSFFLQCAPNPFNESVMIRYALPKSTNTQLVIYNLLGQEVRTLVNEKQLARPHVAMWDGSSASGEKVTSGVYFIRFEAGDYATTGKLLFMR